MMLQNEEVKMLKMIEMKDYCNSWLMMSKRKQKIRKLLSNDRMKLLAFFEREKEKREMSDANSFYTYIRRTKLFNMIACLM